jgi:ABC-type lipoprotein export system ATPase subunit
MSDNAQSVETKGARVVLNDLRREFPMGDEIVRAVNGVSLTIESNECVALVGSSGSGKSTLLHLMGGLETANGGLVTVNGRDLSSLKPNDLARYRTETVGFIFQSFHLFQHRTALENVEMPMTVAGLPKAQRRSRAAAILEEVGLGPRAGHLPSQLSGGERQRVAIARALANQPPLILADEPTGNLDSKNGERVIEVLFNLVKDRGVTLVFATHDLELAKRADRMIRLKDGQLEKDEDPS